MLWGITNEFTKALKFLTGFEAGSLSKIASYADVYTCPSCVKEFAEFFAMRMSHPSPGHGTMDSIGKDGKGKVVRHQDSTVNLSFMCHFTTTNTKTYHVHLSQVHSFQRNHCYC